MTVVTCDVLVVGGGPAGLVAAREAAAADRGLDVLLLERDRAIGAPVRCGEGVGSQGIGEFIDPAGASWISRRITKVIFWAPTATSTAASPQPLPAPWRMRSWYVPAYCTSNCQLAQSDGFVQ